METNIILIGFMGAGKTTFGKWLARTKNMQFLDTDAMIEDEEQMSIRDIFAQKGEGYFRDLETGLLERLIQERKEGIVLSVGGGLPVREKNRELLGRLGTVVYLRASVDTLCMRLQGDTTRPLLQGGNVRERILGLMEKRESLYEAASEQIINTDHLTFEAVLEKLEESIK
jgi:shikimate kinase